MIRRVVGIHFSPVGGTARMTDRLTQQLAEMLRDCSPEPVETETYELLRLGDDTIILDEETVAVLGMPVYVGKVPIPAIKALKNINANGAVAVAAVSYGARTYGNALYELQHFAEDRGFRVVGAGAFSVRYNRRLRGRGTGSGNVHDGADAAGSTMYSGDVRALTEFGTAVAGKIKRLAGCEIEGLKIKPAPLEVSGRLPIHRMSRVSPKAAAIAQGMLERIAVRRRESEWFL